MTGTTFVSRRDFNPVLFLQHLAWVVPLIPPAGCDVWDTAATKAMRR